MNKRLNACVLIACLDKLSLLLLGAVLFAVPVSAHFVRRFFFFSLGCLLARKILTAISGIRPVFRKSYLNTPVLIFVLVMLSVTLLSRNFYESQKIFVERILFYAAIFLLVKETVNTKRKMYFILGAVSVSAFLVGIDALWQYFTGADLFFGYPKNAPYVGYVGPAIALSGPFGSYNFFSGYLEIVVPLIVFLSIVQKRWYVSVFFYSTLAMLLFSWIYVFERGAWLSVALSVVVVSLWFKRRYTVVFITFLIAIAFLLPAPAYQRLAATFRENGDSGRFIIWRDGIEAFNETPLIGRGLSGFSRYPIIQWRGVLHAHNTYLELLVDAGIVGLFSFLYLLGVFLQRSFFSLSNMADEKKKFLLVGLTASCLSYFIAGMFSTNMIVGIGMSAMFWIIFSLAASLPDISFDT